MTNSAEKQPPSMVKVLFEDAGKRMWAQDLGDGLYRIDNVPFFTHLVSCCDIVRAEPAGETLGILKFVSVFARGGHTTFRVLVSEDEEHAKDLEWMYDFLRGAGCTIERATGNLLSIDIPPLPVAEMDNVWLIMGHTEDAGLWKFERGYSPTTPPWERESDSPPMGWE